MRKSTKKSSRQRQANRHSAKMTYIQLQRQAFLKWEDKVSPRPQLFEK